MRPLAVEAATLERVLAFAGSPSRTVSKSPAQRDDRPQLDEFIRDAFKRSAFFPREVVAPAATRARDSVDGAVRASGADDTRCTPRCLPLPACEEGQGFVFAERRSKESSSRVLIARQAVLSALHRFGVTCWPFREYVHG